ncbi:putative meiotic recombination-related protein, partial [Naematelia encephala]
LSLYVPQGNNLGAASYDPEVRKVCVMEDTKDTHAWDLAVLLMEQTQADVIVVSSKAPDSLVDKIEAYCGEYPICKLFIQSFNSFTLGNAYNAISSTRLPDRSIPITSDPASSPSGFEEDESASQVQQDRGYVQEKGAGLGKMRLALVKLGCWVNVNAPAAVCATGGLLSYLIKQPYASEGGRFELAGMESLSLEQHMLINQDALTSLAIFDVDAHANTFMERPKQALSIFGINNSCVTPIGRKLLHTWHLRPLTHLKAIKERHDAVGLFSSTEYQHAGQQLIRSMKKIGNISGWCNNIRRGKAKVTDWKGMIESLLAAREIRETVHGLAASASATLRINEKLEGAVGPELQDFMSQVIGTVDWDASKNEKRLCVRIGVDEELDECRQRLAELEPLLNLVATKISPHVPQDFCKTLNVVYFPQLGHLVAIEPGGRGIQQAPDGWVYKFESEENWYYKTPEMDNLDEHFGDLHSMIIEREINIMQDLTEEMKLVEPLMMAAVDGIAELDCLLALASTAKKYHLVRPHMTDEPILEIREGRHIIFELNMDSYIANDTMLAGGDHEDFRSMMIVTGANGSGKSAYGKQVALITYMAQIGGFVPAKSAKIGIVDKIFTRLQTRESASRVGSAFMIDLSQVSHALRGATDRSLIILDEFGKGTTPADGAGLLAGVIECLMDGPCPRTIVLTHFHELFAQHFLPDTLPILFCHMKTLFIQGDEDITYLYKLSPTIATTSNAAECALLHGVPPDVVARGREVTELMSKFELAKLLDRELTEDEKAELEDAEYLARQFLEWDIDADTQDVMDILKDMVGEAEQRTELRAAERKRSASVQPNDRHEPVPRIEEMEEDEIDSD